MLKIKKNKKKNRKLEVLFNKSIKKSYYNIRLKAPASFTKASPGQFVIVRPDPGSIEPFIGIPLGIYNSGKGHIDLLYKVLGKGTKALSRIKKGEKVGVVGPLGNMFTSEKKTTKKRKAILVAGGHGIAPLYFLAKELLRKRYEVEVLFGVKNKEHVICVSELRKHGAKVFLTSEDGSVGLKGYVTKALRKRIKENKNISQIFACGPRPMLADVVRAADHKGITVQVSADAYIVCGIGVCRGCAVDTGDGYKLVCTDGPVFNGHEIKWEYEKSR